MRLIWLTCGALNVNTYLIGADDTHECIVIDPGEAAPVLERLNQEGLTCTHIFITHGHFDHIEGVAALKRATGAQIYIHADDAGKLSSNRDSLAMMIRRTIEKSEADVLLHDGDTIDAAGLHIRVLHTPGHCKGGVCYVIDSARVIFCGDVLFCDGYGRTDFPGGSERTLYRSIVDKLYTLPGDYTVYCGHEASTTLDHERKNNPLTNRGAELGW